MAQDGRVELTGDHSPTVGAGLREPTMPVPKETGDVLSDMVEQRQSLQAEAKRARRWALAFGLVAMVVIFGGAFSFYEWTTRHRAELEAVRIELSDQRGRGVVLTSQLRDRSRQLDRAQADLIKAEASAGRLRAELAKIDEKLAREIEQQPKP